MLSLSLTSGVRSLALSALPFLVACATPHPLRGPPAPALTLVKDAKGNETFVVAQGKRETPQDGYGESPAPRATPFAGGLTVGRVAIETEGRVTEEEAKAFRRALKAQLEARFPARDKGAQPTRVDIYYRTTYDYRFSGLTLYTVFSLGLFPLGFQEGRTRASVSLVVHPPKGSGDGNKRLSAYESRKFIVAVYPWFRSGPIDEAFVKTHRGAVERVAKGLLRFSRQQRPWPRRKDLYSPFNRRPRGGCLVFDFAPDGTLRTRMDTTSFRVIASDVIYDMAEKNKPGNQDGFFWRYLSALSGLEGGAFFGTAQVSSEAIDGDTGRRFTIASGKASSRGWKLSFYSPPEESGVFIFPTLGFFSLDIDIQDVAQSIPLGRVAGAKDIHAVGSNPTTGAPVDLNAPNVYSLQLRSGYLGQRVGSNFVWGNANFQFFATGQLGLNLFEWRYTNVRLGAKSESGHSAKFLHSFSARGIVGLVYRPWHVMARCELNYELYREFAFPSALPFEAPVRYNEKTQAYERPEIFVDAATAHTLNGFCGLGFHY